jgi:hypothetical protein
LRGVEGLRREGFAPEVYDEELAADHDYIYTNKEVVAVNAFEDVEFVVQAAITGILLA